ncbi:CgeB family protein [Konateibacter massiliensis]|uniref:CgeB family protein n=1 Tax=Konateibacter massiliensis TaxID=2002841 RepID=UPI000C14DF90|nr:DUF3880 domain-containing protein [Konateibacter massiliensis]
MKILVCSWGNIYEPDLALSLMALGHEVKYFKKKIENRDYDVEYLKLLSEELLQTKYDCVFSTNFMPIISRVCNVHHIKYISWLVDSPCFQLNSDTVSNECNYIFIFDYTLYENFRDKSERIYYMPLGTNVRFWDKVSVSEEDKKRFSSEVSFVGSLYEDKHAYDKIELPDYLRGYLDAVIQAQVNIYGYNLMRNLITDKLAEEFYQYAKWNELGEDYAVPRRDVVETEFVGKKCAEVERHKFVDTLAKNFNFDLWTLSDTSSMPHVNNKGPADSREEMPKIFKSSKININMTIKTIETGIPLRIYDIMGNGGFVLTNYQSELLEYFVPGEDLVIYESLDDLIQKVAYYLEHEEERKQIAENGYKKVKEHYTIEKRLEDIVMMVWDDESLLHGDYTDENRGKCELLLKTLETVKMKKVLDVGCFLYRQRALYQPNEAKLKQKYVIEGVELGYPWVGKLEESVYKAVHQLAEMKPKQFDMVVILDLLKFFEKEEIPQLIIRLQQFAKVLLMDYTSEYMEILSRDKKYNVQKLSGDNCELILVTVK